MLFRNRIWIFKNCILNCSNLARLAWVKWLLCSCKLPWFRYDSLVFGCGSNCMERESETDSTNFDKFRYRNRSSVRAPHEYPFFEQISLFAWYDSSFCFGKYFVTAGVFVWNGGLYNRQKLTQRSKITWIYSPSAHDMNIPLSSIESALNRMRYSSAADDNLQESSSAFPWSELFYCRGSRKECRRGTLGALHSIRTRHF